MAIPLQAESRRLLGQRNGSHALRIGIGTTAAGRDNGYVCARATNGGPHTAERWQSG